MADERNRENVKNHGGQSKTTSGYYRFPTLRHNQVVFVSEDDLWSVDLEGGVPRRLSSGLGKASLPALSPDGEWLAFSSTEEGSTEVYLMPAKGGEAQRMTHLGNEARVVGWTHDGEILFSSSHLQPFSRLTDLYALETEHRIARKIECGPASHIHCDERGRQVIARHGGTDLAHWKRYRGGRAGELWIKEGEGKEFRKLLSHPANSARPFFIGDRIYFISDYEGFGQVYSVKPDGSDLKRVTDVRDFYVRSLNVDGTRLIYQAGGDLFTFEVDEHGEALSKPKKIEVEYRSGKTQTNRRFVSASRYLEDYELDPTGETAVVAARGNTFTFNLWKGPVTHHGQERSTRSRLGRFLRDGKRIAVISDAGGEESLEIHDLDDRESVERLSGLDLGRTREMKLSPTADEAALVNHRNELLWVNLETHECKVLDRSVHSRIYGFNWSYDGRYIAYSCAIDERRSALEIYDFKTSKCHAATVPLLKDVSPVFDPLGEFLYFLSYREFDPVYDNLQFDLSFVRGCKPYLMTLRKDVLPPFTADFDAARRGAARKPDAKKADSKNADANDAEASPDTIEIDFENMEDRMVAFPVADGRYGQIAATKDKVYFTRLTIKGSLASEKDSGGDAQLEMFDLETERLETIVSSLSSFRIAKDNKSLIYRSNNSLRVIKTGEKPSRDSDDHRRGGWLDLTRIQIPVHPRAEWRQIFREAWRLQRDHFWTEDMSKIDWVRVYERYRPLLDRVSTRSEVSDVIWEMQGELGTSHAYEQGGDYRSAPDYSVGFLGVETEFDEAADAYKLTRVMKGDLWDLSASSPLARAGVGLKAGDYLIAIDGRKLTLDYRPSQALIHRAGEDVSVTFRRQGSDKTETRSVTTLYSEQRLRYREWVEANRKFVHKKSGGRIGYVHVPNMGPFGYAEFHRGFLTELDRDGLIVDVRFNGGGHVSQLLLEKLARRRIGYSKSRWFGVQPFPEESPTGPMVAITNEYAGSDGDIFSHSFKMLKLGPLIGKRTWGGVIGIAPSHSLVDGGMTTQPEYSFWFADVGWRVENYGTEPDLEVEFEPEAYVSGRDPQLERALAVCEEQILSNPPTRPTLDDGPDLSYAVEDEIEPVAQLKANPPAEPSP